MLLLLLACSGAEKDSSSLPIDSDPTDTYETGDPTDSGSPDSPGSDSSGSDSSGSGDSDPCDTQVYYQDADADGYGAAANTIEACEPVAGYVTDNTDCDDTRADVSPAGTEVCDDADNDCDTAVDEDATDASTVYLDADGDGYGDASQPFTGCAAPTGYTSDNTDCDDADADVHPGATEVCDSVDNNCADGTGDEDGLATYEDASGGWTDVTADLQAGTSTDPAMIGDNADYVLQVDSGTLHLCAGTWYVKVVIAEETTDLSVIGEAGAGETILTTDGEAGGEMGSMLSVDSGTLTVEGVTLQHGAGSYNPDGDNYRGGAIIVDNATSLPAAPNLTLISSVVESSSADYGGAIAILRYGYVALEDTLVQENSASVSGGAVWFQADGLLECSASSLGAAGFYANTAGTYGGALYLSAQTGGNLDSVGCDFGDTGTTDDNSPYDLQQNNGTTSPASYCYGDAASTATTLACAGGTCTASNESCP